MLVLVVDDEAEIRQVVRRSLERAGLDVVDAADPETALRLARDHAVDVAVLDLDLPVMTGLELMTGLRQDDPALPVIMLSGSGGEADRVHGLMSGADDYVAKPFSGPELVARVIAADRRRNGTTTTTKLREQATGIRSQVADAVVITDIRLRIQSFNPAAESLYGWREDEVVGSDSMDVMPWLCDAATFEQMHADFERDGRWHGEVLQRHRDGSLITVRSSATLLRDDSGQPVGLVLVNRLANGAARLPSPKPSQDAALVADICRGIDQGEFVLHYQPIVSLDDGAWMGVEALLRWEHPERGMLLPAEFIGAAERSGTIVDLGQMVLDEATAEWRRWADAGLELDVAVNLSGRQLADPNLTARIAAAVDAASMPRGVLHLEVTETALVEDLVDAREVLTVLTDLGTAIAIDDFGTGWASLTYLRTFPVQALKVDRIFVHGLGSGTDASDSAIASSIISLGRELGLAVIAEGIETPDQLARLRQLGCQQGQGYHFARPMTADQISERVR